jgi:hypothetical protein
MQDAENKELAHGLCSEQPTTQTNEAILLMCVAFIQEMFS